MRKKLLSGGGYQLIGAGYWWAKKLPDGCPELVHVNDYYIVRRILDDSWRIGTDQIEYGIDDFEFVLTVTHPDQWFSYAYYGIKALNDVFFERRRQINKGYDAEHDDEHVDGEIARAAISHALHAVGESTLAVSLYPFEGIPEPKDARTELVKAASMLIAEIERLDRVADRSAAKAEG